MVTFLEWVVNQSGPSVCVCVRVCVCVCWAVTDNELSGGVDRSADVTQTAGAHHHALFLRRRARRRHGQTHSSSLHQGRRPARPPALWTQTAPSHYHHSPEWKGQLLSASCSVQFSSVFMVARSPIFDRAVQFFWYKVWLTISLKTGQANVRCFICHSYGFKQNLRNAFR